MKSIHQSENVGLGQASRISQNTPMGNNPPHASSYRNPTTSSYRNLAASSHDNNANASTFGNPYASSSRIPEP